MTVFIGGCAKLRAVCRPMEVRGAATVMADAEVVHGESAASAVAAEALCGGAEAADMRHGVAAWRCCAATEAAAARCNTMKRRPGSLAFERDDIDGVFAERR